MAAQDLARIWQDPEFDWHPETVRGLLGNAALERLLIRLLAGGRLRSDLRAMAVDYHTALDGRGPAGLRGPRNPAAAARLRMGDRFATGDGVPPRPDKALCWYSAAAQWGNLEAGYRLLQAQLAQVNAAPPTQRDYSRARARFESLRETCQRVKATELLLRIEVEWLQRGAGEAVDAAALLARAEQAAEALPAPLLDALRQRVAAQHQAARAAQQVIILPYLTPATSMDSSEKAALQRYEPLLRPIPLATLADPGPALDTLRNEFPWMERIIDWIARQMQFQLYNGQTAIRLRPLLLVGGYGVGKTRFAQRLASLFQLPSLVLPASGSSDNRALQGTARGWSTGQPGLVVQLMAERRIANPLVVIDELDKAGTSTHNGRIWDTLLQMTERTNARQVFDEYLYAPVDLSHVSWVATANDVAQLPGALLSRFTVLAVPQPQRAHYPAIIASALADIAREMGVEPEALPPLDAAAWAWLERHYDSPRQAIRALRLYLELEATRQRRPAALH